MRILLKDIAAAAGVQPSTASLVLRNQPGARKFSRATRDSVRATATRMGYVAGNRDKRTKTIAFVLSGAEKTDWSNGYFSRFIAPVENVCHANGYNLLISRITESEIERDYFPSRNGERAVDGVIVIGYVSKRFQEKIAEQKLPCICLGDDIADRNAGMATFAIDAVGMFMQILRYLVSMDHAHVVLLLENHERQLELGAELREVLQHSDIAAAVTLEQYINPENCSDEEKGHAFLWHLIDIAAKERPTAIVCNDRIGVSILGALSKYNMSCPGDISIVATSDGELCNASAPRLTGVNIGAEFAEYAARFLINRLEKEKPIAGSDSRNDFPTRLVIRDSVRSPGENAELENVG